MLLFSSHSFNQLAQVIMHGYEINKDGAENLEMQALTVHLQLLVQAINLTLLALVVLYLGIKILSQTLHFSQEHLYSSEYFSVQSCVCLLGSCTTCSIR